MKRQQVVKRFIKQSFVFHLPICFLLAMALPPLNRYKGVSNTIFKATALTLSTAAVIGNIYVVANLFSIISYRRSKSTLEESSTREN